MTNIDATRRREADYLNDALDALPSAATTGRTTPRELDPSSIASSKIDDAAFATWARSSAGKAKDVAAPTAATNQPAAKATSNKDVIYIGMNGGEGTEAAAISLSTGVHIARHDDVAQLGRRRYDLNKPEDRDAFALALTRDPARAAKFSAVLQSSGARSETAHLAMMLARGDNGTGPVPSRLVLSGHNTGDGPHGKRSLSFDEVKDVARLFPKGAAVIESIQFSACSSASELNVNRSEWQSAFPGLTSMWGYDGQCPLGAAEHAAAWEHGTHGTAELRIGNAQRAANVAVWTIQSGYDAETVRDPAKAQEKLDRANDAIKDGRSEKYRNGELPLNVNHGALERDYRSLQAVAARSDFPPEVHARYVAEAAKTGALFTFDHHDGVRDRFAAAFGKEVNAALREAGLETRDFSTMGYNDALDCKKEVDAAVAASTTPSASLLLAQHRMNELLSLDPHRTKALLAGGTP